MWTLTREGVNEIPCFMYFGKTSLLGCQSSIQHRLQYCQAEILLFYSLFTDCELSHFNCVWLFVTLGTVPRQASSVHEILQARILEWVAIPFSRGSSWPRFQTRVSCVAARFFTVWATREAPYLVIRGKLIFIKCRQFRARPTHSSRSS